MRQRHSTPIRVPSMQAARHCLQPRHRSGRTQEVCDFLAVIRDRRLRRGLLMITASGKRVRVAYRIYKLTTYGNSDFIKGTASRRKLDSADAISLTGTGLRRCTNVVTRFHQNGETWSHGDQRISHADWHESQQIERKMLHQRW